TFSRVEELGGVVPAIEQGFFQREITRAAYEYQMALARKKKILVGVNEFVNTDERIEIPVLEIDESVEKDQVGRLAEIRRHRDNLAVQARLAGLRKAAAGTDNLIPHLLESARVYATVGEITEALIAVFGEYREQPFY
ncbi:MAG: methylmalonyl-CoA mutase family protein, partial [Candidatus Aminicenantales bacterium]